MMPLVTAFTGRIMKLSALFVLASLQIFQAASLHGQAQERVPAIPAAATGLEGRPSVKVETTEDGAVRRVLSDAEAAQEGLRISIVDGRYYREARDTRPLTVHRLGGFVYLSGAEPGHYIRLTEINGTLKYVEHVATNVGNVTYWGELRIVIGGR
jgi:hypothetical protein